MFHFLNRCLQACVWLFWLSVIAALVWQRERARPALDYAILWKQANWSSPPELPRMRGTITRVLGNTTFYLRSDDSRIWSIGQQGCDTNALPQGVEGLRLSLETYRLLTNTLVGQPIELAFTRTNTTRTALGFIYLQETNSLLLQLVSEGRCTVLPDETRALPIREQYRLRIAERQARREARGMWARLSPER